MSRDWPFTIPSKFPEVDPAKGRWVAYSNATKAKIVSQGNDKEKVLQKAAKKGCKPPILIMECKWMDKRYECVDKRRIPKPSF